MTSKSKNDIFYFMVLILTMITMVVGMTFTYFNLMAKEDDDSTDIRTGTLKINYVDGSSVNTYGLYPITEPNLNSTYGVYRKHFAVASNGTLDQTLQIYINITENQFDNNALRYAIYDSSNRKIGIGSLPKSGSVLIASDIYLESNTTKEFTVLIWLEENNQNQNYEQGNTFTGGFDITASQIKYE